MVRLSKKPASDVSERVTSYFEARLGKPTLVTKFPDPNLYPVRRRCEIALLPMNVPANAFETVRKRTRGGAQLAIKRIKQTLAEDIACSMIAKIRHVCEAGARVICLSEYCYPVLVHDFLSKSLAGLAERYKTYIVAGSYAETESNKPHYNTCLVFTPFSPEPLRQYKNQKGKFGNRDEQIDIPSDPEVEVFHTKYGTFAILICADVLDVRNYHNLRIINSPGRRPYPYEPIDLVLVPAYTDKPGDVRFGCQDFSRNTGTCVAYANDTTFGDHSKVYVCGDEKKDTVSSDGSVHSYSLDLASLGNSRLRLLSNTLTTSIPAKDE